MRLLSVLSTHYGTLRELIEDAVALDPVAVVVLIFLFLVVLIGVTLGLAWAGKGLTHLTRAIDLIRTDTTRVGDVPLADGPIELAGVARETTGTVSAPFSGTSCLVCEYLAEDTSGRTTWTIASGRIGSHFLLEDDTGSVVLDASDALLNAEQEYVDLPKAESDAPPAVQEFLSNHPNLRYRDLRSATPRRRRRTAPW